MMTPNKKKRTAFALSFVLLFSASTFADVKRYESGLGRDWDFWSPNRRHLVKLTESEAIKKFISENFGTASRNGSWIERKVSGDSTHSHRFYNYVYKGRRVDGIGLAIHYNREGFVEYADSDLENYISLDFEPDSEELRERVLEKLRPELEGKMGRSFGTVEWEPILWRGESDKPFIPAYQIRVVYRNPNIEKNLIVDQLSAKILSEFSKARAASSTVKVFKDANVDESGTDVALTSGITIVTENDSALLNSVVHVKREQFSGGVFGRREITPLDKSLAPARPSDYTSSGFFKTSPTEYAASCSGEPETNDCANQNFDGVNVYYHLTEYRTFLNNYLTSFGDSTNFPDPLGVVVNSRNSGLGTADNAFYWDSTLCGDGLSRCILFLPPSGIPECEGKPFNNFAREGFVVAHEYQHYITDIISGIEFGTSGKKTVGDSLHEGYSDYGAATYLTQLNGTDVTLGLKLAPVCSEVRRNVGTLKVYAEVTAPDLIYQAGLSWASALWQLRKDYNKTVADKLAYKSLYFLGSNPGFVGAVESLVKADRALYAGVHVDRIRELLYSEVKFLGSASESFKSPETLEARVGFKGCAGVNSPQSGTENISSSVCFLIWGFITIGLGRFLKREMVA